MSSSPRRLALLASRPLWFALVSAVAAGTFLTACGGGSGGTEPVAAPATPAMPLGQKVYTRSCARCHGLTMKGKFGTPAIDAVRLRTLGDQNLRITIMNGKGKMPAFTGLTPTQVDALVAYLNSAV